MAGAGAGMGPDGRFFSSAEPLTLADLAGIGSADLVRGEPDQLIDSVAPLALADRRGVAFFSDPKYRADLTASAAGAIFLPESQIEAAPEGAALLVTRRPQAAWAAVARRLHPVRLSGGEAIHPTAKIEDDVLLGPGVVLGEGAAVGRGTRIGANTVIGPGVQIGRNCEIGANVSLGFALVGDRVRILAGAVIGEAGFGAAAGATGPVDVPQLGRVILQDDVSIGAATCVDRGAYDDTVVGEGTKIDNLCQIAHNVRLGRGCLVAAHTGISGSAVIGDGVMFGGRAGVADHLTVGAGARIAAAAAVLQSVPAGETWSGYPAKPVRQFLRESVWVSKQAARREGKDHG